jgi:galactose mutarotase-like enzyme
MVELKSGSLTIRISDEGAEIHSIQSAGGVEYIWRADKDVWPRHAPVLFPIVGRLKNNKYFYKEESYELGQHGFARDLKFKLKNHNEDSCSFELISTNETRKKYPFDFIFVISYTLKENILETAYKINNPSSETLYAAVGAHPGFNCPLVEGEKFEDYFIEFEKGELYQTPLTNGLRSDGRIKLDLKENKLHLSAALFDNDALVFENNQVNRISLKSTKSSAGVEMTCEGWPYFGIWTKKNCREFICLEPWYGITDRESTTQQLTEKDGIISISAGKDFNCSFSITIY